MFSVPIEPVLVFILVFIRVIFLLSFLPVFSDPFTPVRARILLALSIALMFTPLTDLAAADFPQTVPQFMALMLPEAIFGMSLGFVGRIFFATIQFAGSIIGRESGFQFANVFDPTRAFQTPVVAQVLYIGSILVFFGVNGDHIFFNALAQSFQNAPPGYLSVRSNIHVFFNQQAVRMFFIAVQMSLPIMAAIFVLNVGMSMLAKGAPRINVFMERFPLAIITGLILLSLLSNFYVRYFINMIGDMRRHVAELLRIMGA